jgi:hypothetical protein
VRTFHLRFLNDFRGVTEPVELGDKERVDLFAVAGPSHAVVHMEASQDRVHWARVRGPEPLPPGGTVVLGHPSPGRFVRLHAAVEGGGPAQVFAHGRAAAP